MNILNDQFKTYRKNPSVVCTELDEGAVLLNLDTKYYFNLNETGLRIWQIVEESLNPMEIAEKLSCEYDVDVERAKSSVIRILGELEKEALIVSTVK
ncbi:MAG: PqqD family protein [Nitrospirae bacterium]|nr:PqqD family protein [Nitrospirota bacterium]